MEDYVEKFRQADALAQNILRLTRNTLLVNLRFLDLALSQFQLTSYPGTLATDGQHLFYDTYYVLSMYKRERGRNVRDYLHIVLHCVFRHLFTSANIDRRCWDLACDIAVESAIEDLHLESAACNRAYAQEETLKELRSQVRPLTAEKLYRYFLDRHLSDDQIARLRVVGHCAQRKIAGRPAVIVNAIGGQCVGHQHRAVLNVADLCQRCLDDPISVRAGALRTRAGR